MCAGEHFGTVGTVQWVVLCRQSEVRFWERALSEVVEALWECQSRDRASGTLREAAQPSAEEGQPELGGVDSPLR